MSTASKAESWTVVGDSLLPIAVVDEFLAYCTAVGRSPLTVETYAYALATLFRFLGDRRLDWRELTLEQAARFVECLQARGSKELGTAARTSRRAGGHW